MSKSTKCCFCGWTIPAGKGNSAVPANMKEDALCCNWCAAHVVNAAKAAVEKVVSEMSMCSVADQQKINAEKEAMND